MPTLPCPNSVASALPPTGACSAPLALPDFALAQAERVLPALQWHLAQAQAARQTVCSAAFAANWQTLSATLGVALEGLHRCWGEAQHLQAVLDTPALRAAINAMLAQVSSFYAQLDSDPDVYATLRRIDGRALPSAAARALSLALRQARLSGAALDATARTRYQDIAQRLAELQQKFGENVLDASDAFCLDVDAAHMVGVPADVQAACAQQAQAAGLVGRYRLSLHLPVYWPILQYAQDRELRRVLFSAYATRASDVASAQTRPEHADSAPAPALDNSAVIEEILALRAEEAALLGFEHYAALALVGEMAGSAEEVTTFLLDLAQQARPFAERDAADLRAFARTHLALPDPQPWDWTFISERMKEHRFAFNDQEVKAYFSLKRVLTGLFDLLQSLFGVSIQALPAGAVPVWHEQVQVGAVVREGTTIAHYYFDPYARVGKQSGAWMHGLRNRWLRPDGAGPTLQTPIAIVVCNFTPPQEGRDSLLTHDDVITLLHEFGHGLHHMLTTVDEYDVAGLYGVERDAVELPSQMMENFCWEWDVLQTMSAHVDSGAPLPRALYERMLAAKHFQSGLRTLRQVEFALLDMRLHSHPHNFAAAIDLQATLQAVRAHTAVLPPLALDRPAHSFSHIFAGGYAAGYYSYEWAKVLSADVYEAFAQAQQPQQRRHVGARYAAEILQVGGSRGAMESFIAFRGRQPDISALLRQEGMSVQAAHAMPSPPVATDT